MVKFLIFNAGSSSIKFKLFEKVDTDSFKNLKSGAIDRIGEDIKDHREALNQLIDMHRLNLNDVDIIGHRVVHGGQDFSLPTEMTKKNLKKLKKYNKLAPIHNPHQVRLIKTVADIFGNVAQWAVFDTGFFTNLPEKAKIYPLPINYYKDYGIRRYGFHGISHKYLSQAGSAKLKLELTQSNLITAHLGAGSSITAIKKGVPVDTSLGFTPLEGLMMQTRPGDIDPGIITYLQKERKMSVNQIDDLLNNRSGLLGIAGRGDMRDILFLAGEKVEDESYQPKGFDDCKQIDIDRAKLALKMFCYRVSKYIGAYNVILGGLDGLIFGGAIGSGSSILRRKISREISKTIKGVKITHLETNEELQIAKEIAHFLAK